MRDLPWRESLAQVREPQAQGKQERLSWQGEILALLRCLHYMSNKPNNLLNPTVELDGLEVEITRGVDGALVVTISGPGDDDTTALGSPDIRVWLNDALIYAHGETGDDLQWTPPPAKAGDSE